MVVFPGEQEWNDARSWVVVQQNDCFSPILPPTPYILALRLLPPLLFPYTLSPLSTFSRTTRA